MLKKSQLLLRIRLCIFTFNLLHLAFVSYVLLTIDFTKSSDPRIWAYQHFKWKFITSWFSFTNFLYFPICIYCDWRELRGESDRTDVKILNKIRYLCYSSILLPTTTFSDILFWRLWNKNRELIAPAAIDELVPHWTQHSMHTYSLVVVLMDLFLVPRKRPKSLKPGVIIMLTFLTCYVLTCVYNLAQGENIYPLFKTLSMGKMGLLILYMYIEHLCYFTGQWFIIDMIWGQKTTKLKIL